MGSRPVIGLILCVCVAGFSVPILAQDWTFSRGDLNGDGDLSLEDPLSLLDFVFIAGSATPVCIDAGDFDDDGTLSLIDAIDLLTYMFANGPPPAPPFPDCGFDPTEDELSCAGPLTGCPPGVPDAPTALEAVAVSHESIQLTWQDNSLSETFYEVERSTTGIDGTYERLTTLGPDATSYEDRGLSGITEYCYRVRAGNDLDVSEYSDPDCAETPAPPLPDAPSDVVVNVISFESLEILWTDNSMTETGFEIERSTDGVEFVLLATVDANTVLFEDRGLTPSTEYCYRVRAINGAGESPVTEPVCGTTDPPPPPAPPGDPTVTAISFSELEVAWVDNSDDETGFEVERSSAGAEGPFEPLVSLGPDVTLLVDSGLEGFTEYCYRVRAINDFGVSEFTVVACGTTLPPPPPAAPEGLLANDVSQFQIDLTWVDNSSTETGFDIERSVDGAGGTFTLLATAPADSTAFSDTGLTPGAEYCYRVRAVHGFGVSEYSNTDCATPPIGPPPAAPTGLVVNAAGDIDFAWDSPHAYDQPDRARTHLIWDDNSDNEFGFEIERSDLGPGGPFEFVALVAADMTDYIDSHLSFSTEYCYRIRSVNEHDDTPFTDPVCVTTDPPSAPQMPSGLALTKINGSMLELTWADNASDETGFEIERSANGGAFAFLTTVAANPGVGAVSYLDTGLSQGTFYCYQIRSVNDHGVSGFTGQSPGDTQACTTASLPFPTPPPPPEGAPHKPDHLNVTVLQVFKVAVTWRDNSYDETGFELQRRADGGRFVTIETLPPQTRHYFDFDVDPGVEYCYRVRSQNEAGASLWASPKCKSTIAAAIKVTKLFDTEVFEVSGTGPRVAPGSYGSDSYLTRVDIPHFDWTSPVDYANGQIYTRLDILERPSLVPFRSTQVINEPGVGGDHWWTSGEYAVPIEPRSYRTSHDVQQLRDVTGLLTSLANPPELRMHFAVEVDGVNAPWSDPDFFPFQGRFSWVAVASDGVFPGWGTLVGAERPRIEPYGQPFVASYPGPILVTISTATRGSEIRYTLDGSEPIESSPLYSGPFEVSASTTVRAKTFNPGSIEDSDITSVTFILER